MGSLKPGRFGSDKERRFGRFHRFEPPESLLSILPITSRMRNLLLCVTAVVLCSALAPAPRRGRLSRRTSPRTGISETLREFRRHLEEPDGPMRPATTV